MKGRAIGSLVVLVLAARTLPAEIHCLPGNRLLDGGFDASTGDPANSPAWLESSTHFVTPICRYETCGFNIGPVLAYDPPYWLWFGGALAPEHATVSQIVSLPGAAEIELRFWLHHGHGTEPLTDTLTVRFDGVALDTFFEVEEADIGHTLHTYPLDAFADGGSYTLLFEYDGPSPGVGSFSVDEISIDVTACLPDLFADGFESQDTSRWSATVP